MKEIILDCPCCHNQIYIELDKSFNVISVKHKCKNKISDIEFGTLKEGEIQTNE